MNKVKFGLSNVHYAIKSRAEDGTISYAKPVPIPGAVNLSLDQEGEITPFYADNIVFYSANKNNGYSGNLEIADIHKSFYIDVLGYKEDTNVAIVENADAIIKEFALLYEVKGDEKPRRAVLYNCNATRPSVNAETSEDSAKPNTDTLKLTATAREDNKNVKAVMELSDENSEAYNSFYTSVYNPTMA